MQVLSVVKKSAEPCHTLLGVIVTEEYLLKTVLHEEVTILIDAIAKLVHVFAPAHVVVKVREKLIDDRVDAGRILADNLLSVEVWNTFATHVSSKDILVSVDEGVNASLAKLVDQFLDLVQVGLIVDTLLALNCFPHDTETDKVHAPLLHIFDVFVIQ